MAFVTGEHSVRVSMDGPNRGRVILGGLDISNDVLAVETHMSAVEPSTVRLTLFSGAVVEGRIVLSAPAIQRIGHARRGTVRGRRPRWTWERPR